MPVRACPPKGGVYVLINLQSLTWAEELQGRCYYFGEGFGEEQHMGQGREEEI